MKIFKSIILFSSISLFSFSFLSCDKCEHNYEKVLEVEASCIKAGYIKYQCILCNKEKTEPILSSGHNYSDFIITFEGDCLNDGIKERICLECGHKEIIKFKNDVHDYEIVTVDATCDEGSYEIKTCKLCKETIKNITSTPLGHKLTDWSVDIPATEVTDGIEIRKCNNCDFLEKKYIPSTSYINLDIFRNNLNINEFISVNSEDELQLVFDTAILNRIESVEVDINYNNFNFEKILDTLVKNCTVDSSYKVRTSYGSTLSLFFDYNEAATVACSDTNAYFQYSSSNYSKYTSSRDESFNNFKINNSIYSYKVKTSDQLYYVLERGVLPICEKDSSAEKNYLSAKSVLRNIIDDNMTDFEKIKAIHDYLVLNVTYDDDLLKLAMNNSTDISKYNGFYLEGVFNDKRAVCEGISKAFTVLCNIEGIKCVVVTGKQANNPSGMGHAWNKVYLDGKWYIVDVTSDGTIINNSYEILSYQYFLISEDKMNKRYIGENFSNIICDGDYDNYKLMNYILEGKINDFYIESFDELVEMIKYFESSNANNNTIEFKICFDFGSSIIDDIQNAYNKLHIQSTFSHISSDDIFIIIK